MTQNDNEEIQNNYKWGTKWLQIDEKQMMFYSIFDLTTNKRRELLFL